MGRLAVKAFIDCACHNPVVISTKGGYFCKNCSQRISIELSGKDNGTFHSRRRNFVLDLIDEALQAANAERITYLSEENKSLSARIYDLETTLIEREAAFQQLISAKRDADMAFIEAKNSRDEYCSRRTKHLKNKISEMEATEKNLKDALDEKVREYDLQRAKISALESDIDSLELEVRRIRRASNRYEGIIDKQTGIIAGFKTSLAKSEEVRDRLTSENDALNESLRHFRNEAETFSKIPLRESVSIFLDYMTAVFNLAVTKCPDDVRESLLARTDYSRMMLSNYGISINYHLPGDVCPDGRADIHPVNTEDPSLDGKIMRMNKFGCSFKEGLFADIPEDVSVFCAVKAPAVTIVEETPLLLTMPKTKIESTETQNGMTDDCIPEENKKYDAVTTEETKTLATVSMDNNDFILSEEMIDSID